MANLDFVCKVDKNETSLKKPLLYLLRDTVLVGGVIGISFLTDNYRILALLYALSLIFFIFLILSDIICLCTVISNKRKINSKKRKKYHGSRTKSVKESKYNSISIMTKDIKFWISYAETPDKIIISIDENEYEIEILFDYVNRFIDKCVTLNGSEVTENTIFDFLDKFYKVKVVWYTENNNPKLFAKTITYLKNKYGFMEEVKKKI